MKIHMNGSEWFGTLAGGLNRYFESLHGAMVDRSDIDVSAWAFGGAPRGGSSWGPLDGSTLDRVRASRRVVGSAPDLVDTHFALYGRRRFQSAPGAVRLHHFQGPWFEESAAAGAGRLTQKAKFQLEKAVYARGDHFVVLSPRFKDLLSDVFSVDSEKITILSPGVDLERFPFRSAAQPSKTVVCVRRLERRMGIDVLLASWPAVLARVPDARLRIVGTGTEELALRDQAHRLGLDSSVDFEGKLSDVDLVQCYSDAALSVVPSTALEGFGLIALESMAVGTPAVVTDCGGLPEAVKGLDETLVVPVGDVDALARRLVDGLSGCLPDRRAAAAHAARFTWTAAADRHVELYRRLIADRSSS